MDSEDSYVQGVVCIVSCARPSPWTLKTVTYKVLCVLSAVLGHLLGLLKTVMYKMLCVLSAVLGHLLGLLKTVMYKMLCVLSAVLGHLLGLLKTVTYKVLCVLSAVLCHLHAWTPKDSYVQGAVCFVSCGRLFPCLGHLKQLPGKCCLLCQLCFAVCFLEHLNQLLMECCLCCTLSVVLCHFHAWSTFFFLFFDPH